VLEGHQPVPADLETWGRWFENFDNRRVALDVLPRGIQVSTVFLGLDHSWLEDSPPLVFETMIFGGDHDQYQARYSTWDEAVSGHQQAVVLAGSAREGGDD